MSNFLHNFSPAPILWQFGLLKIYWYGLVVSLAILICAGLALKLFKKLNLNQSIFMDLVFYLVIFGLIGARAWHVVFYNFDYFFASPVEIFKLWRGGLAIQGGLAGGLATIYFFSKKRICILPFPFRYDPCHYRFSASRLLSNGRNIEVAV